MTEKELAELLQDLMYDRTFFFHFVSNMKCLPQPFLTGKTFCFLIGMNIGQWFSCLYMTSHLLCKDNSYRKIDRTLFGLPAATKDQRADPSSH